MSEATKPTPESRRRTRDPHGVPVTLADGNTWILAHGTLAPVLLPIIDRIYDQVLLKRQAPIGDVIRAAWILLLVNYDLDDEDLDALLRGLEGELETRLAEGVVDALLGAERDHRTYTEWVLSSFYANGIDPSDVPARFVKDVMRILVNTGRTVQVADFVSSAEAFRFRAGIARMVSRPKG